MKFIKNIINKIKAAILRMKIKRAIIKSIELQVKKRNVLKSQAYRFKLVPHGNRRLRRAYG